jgi:hypothetical protein
MKGDKKIMDLRNILLRIIRQFSLLSNMLSLSYMFFSLNLLHSIIIGSCKHYMLSLTLRHNSLHNIFFLDYIDNMHAIIKYLLSTIVHAYGHIGQNRGNAVAKWGGRGSRFPCHFGTNGYAGRRGVEGIGGM